MPHQEKNTKGRSNSQLSIIIPLVGTLFLKKPLSEESSKENSIDFHLEMIKKIDKLLEEREPETPQENSLSMGQRSTVPLPTSVESRAPLGRTPGHIEVEWEHPIKPSPFTPRTIPEEFKTDLPLSMNPDFKFITSLDSAYDVLHIKQRTDERVEIIDISSLMGDQITSQKTTAPLIIKQPSKKTVSSSDQRQRKKTEVIDTPYLQKQNGSNTFIAAMKQAEKSEQKFKMYYLNSITHKEKKQENERSYIPVDFDERAEELKEQQQQEEQKKKEQEEKIQKQLNKEHEKLEKLETKKTILEEKKQVKDRKEQKKEEPPLKSKPDKTHRTEREQRRLEKLQARKARLEEKKHKKEAKKALKEKKKQALLKQKGKEKKHKTTQEKHHKKDGFFKKEKHQTSFEIDDDIKKILSITDSLLGELPEDVIDRFTQSDDFELYEKVLNKYKIK